MLFNVMHVNIEIVCVTEKKLNTDYRFVLTTYPVCKVETSKNILTGVNL